MDVVMVVRTSKANATICFVFECSPEIEQSHRTDDFRTPIDHPLTDKIGDHVLEPDGENQTEEEDGVDEARQHH